jgi:alkanesulfonate monooxygenase SsuD/methylene tetrahydromethanopterin reductase-like flavin-dependent oxidoreductase (luciferase family)
VQRAGRYVRIDDVRFLPRPVQAPRIPLWFASRGDALRPARRAARYDGLFAIEVDHDQLRRMLDAVVEVRGTLDGFDVAVWGPPFDDIAGAEGVTWAMTSLAPDEPFADALAIAAAGPVGA